MFARHRTGVRASGEPRGQEKKFLGQVLSLAGSQRPAAAGRTLCHASIRPRFTAPASRSSLRVTRSTTDASDGHCGVMTNCCVSCPDPASTERANTLPRRTRPGRHGEHLHAVGERVPDGLVRGPGVLAGRRHGAWPRVRRTRWVLADARTRTMTGSRFTVTASDTHVSAPTPVPR